ncbi:M23 family metallopeptidase [Salinibacterium sp. PAMC 21357]|uniref:M23 family metallopeptidase n=1 Tax=Salinibacterium sp. PAMC 21357 TaxID=1112215 RepID=UPI000288034D|nr:M23 family metallopeptidase [Salinibacterium sp. PAMC 21357]
MSLDAAFPQRPETGEHIPLTRKQLRERERAADRGNNKRGSQHVEQPVEAPVVPVLADLFTPSTVAAPVVVEAVVVEAAIIESPIVEAVIVEPAIDSPVRVDIEAVLPSRRSQRAQVATPTKASKSTKSPKVPRASKSSKVASAPRSRKAEPTTVRSKRIRVSSATFTAQSASRRPGKSFASKSLSLAAMIFAGALLVGVSVPSNVFLSSEDVAAIAAPEPETPNLAADSRPTQSLAVSDAVVAEVAEHDSLEVISYAEILALKYAGISYEYRTTAGAVRWPFPNQIPITDGFGNRIGGFHKGTDFAAAQGTPIYAIADGVVSYIQSDYTGYGYNAIISHVINGQQVQSQYAHMVTGSSPLVVGDPIRVGDFVGLVGQTGRSYGAHLHLEIHLDKVPVDPFAWLSANAVN